MTTDNIFSGLKVVDFASFIAGPSAAVILSDLGADVIAECDCAESERITRLTTSTRSKENMTMKTQAQVNAGPGLEEGFTFFLQGYEIAARTMSTL